MDGLAPAIAIKQKNQTRNPRSTVATATEIYDYLRLLYARCGTVTCLHCGGTVRRDTVDEIVPRILALPEGTRVYALFPIDRGEIKLEPMQVRHQAEHEPEPKPKRAAKKSGQRRKKPPHPHSTSPTRSKSASPNYAAAATTASTNPASIVEFSTPESLLELDFAATPIYVLADRLALSPDIRSRLVDAIETGYRESGEIQFRTLPREDEATPQTLRFSSAFECSSCHRAYREPEPRLFSFNNPYGACPRCQGFGNTIDFDPNLIIPDRSKSLDAGAIDPWTKPKYRSPWHAEMKRAAKAEGIPTNIPWYDLTDAQQRFIYDGRGPNSGPASAASSKPSSAKNTSCTCASSSPSTAATPPAPTAAASACAPKPAPSPLPSTTKNICEATALTITEAREFFNALTLSPSQQEIAGKVLEEVRQRIHFLEQVGLEYLTLDRLASTLSGGESQRIQLATSLGSRLVGALYVLDEPSIGLHTRDTAKLIRIMEELRDLGNTILVVEHDPDVIRAADHLLDLGPGAGELGGRLLAAGTVDEVRTTRTPSPANISPAARKLPSPSIAASPAARSSSSKARASTTFAAWTSKSRSACSVASPASAAPANPRSSTRSSTAHSSRPSARATQRRLQHLPRALRHALPQRRRARRPVAHRPHAALQPRHLHQGLRRHPRALRRAARRHAARTSPPAASASTFPAAAATSAKATALSPSRCSSSPTSSSPAKSATPPATKPPSSRSSTRARTSTTSST